jgi:hypothetical protein
VLENHWKSFQGKLFYELFLDFFHAFIYNFVAEKKRRSEYHASKIVSRNTFLTFFPKIFSRKFSNLLLPNKEKKLKWSDKVVFWNHL